MKLLTHQCPLGPVFMIFSTNVVLRRYYAKILVAKLKHIRKKVLIDYSLPEDCSVVLVQDYHSSPDEATDSSVSSGACFHEFL